MLICTSFPINDFSFQSHEQIQLTKPLAVTGLLHRGHKRNVHGTSVFV